MILIYLCLYYALCLYSTTTYNNNNGLASAQTSDPKY